MIVDLGAGALEAHLELFKAADEKFLVTSPEPTSIEKKHIVLLKLICATLCVRTRLQLLSEA